MAVEHLDPALVREVQARIAQARRTVSDAHPESRHAADDPSYWQALFEDHAAAVLAVLPRVRLAAGRAVRYRCYGRHGRDVRVRPFVTRAGTDVSGILALLDWHPPPDAIAAPMPHLDRDVELLYRHFTFEPTAAGAFEYWLAMQELWASQRWVYSSVLADAAELAQLTAGGEWRVERPVERVAPAILTGGGDGVHVAALVHCALERHTVTYHRVRVGLDHSVEFAESLLVASGPRGVFS